MQGFRYHSSSGRDLLGRTRLPHNPMHTEPQGTKGPTMSRLLVPARRPLEQYVVCAGSWFRTRRSIFGPRHPLVGSTLIAVLLSQPHTPSESLACPTFPFLPSPKGVTGSHMGTKIARTCLHPRVLALWVRTRLGHMNKPPKVSALTATFTICIRPFGSKAGLNRHPALARLPPGIPPWRWYSSRRQATWAQNFSKIASVGRVVPEKLHSPPTSTCFYH